MDTTAYGGKGQGKGKGRGDERLMGTTAVGGKGQKKGKGNRKGRIGQGGRGRTKGGERLMGTTTYGGKGSKHGRALSSLWYATPLRSGPKAPGGGGGGGCLTPAFSGAHKRAEMLRNPCFLGGPQ